MKKQVFITDSSVPIILNSQQPQDEMEIDEVDEVEEDEPESFFQDIYDTWHEEVANRDWSLMNNEQQRLNVTLKKCRRLAASIARSSLAQNFIEILRVQAQVSCSLILDCPTRWNSTYRLIHGLVVNKSVLNRFFLEFNGTVRLSKSQQRKWAELELNREDWLSLEILEAVLRPFHDATKMMSAQKYPTMGIAYFVVSGIKDFLLDQSSPNERLNTLKSLLLHEIAYYFDNDLEQYRSIKVMLSSIIYFHPNIVTVEFSTIYTIL